MYNKTSSFFTSIFILWIKFKIIGTENLSINDKPADIAKGVKAILDVLRQKIPHAAILMLSVLPRNTVPLDTAVHQLNSLIAAFADNKSIHYLDLGAHFETSLAHEKKELYLGDQLHLSEKGYEMWHKVMEPSFAMLIQWNSIDRNIQIKCYLK